MDITYEVDRLINFAIRKNLITKYDYFFIQNQILNLLALNKPYENKSKIINEKLEKLDSAIDIINNILDYCIAEDIIENTITEKDLFVGKLMGLLTDRPVNIRNNFYSLYEKDKKVATYYFYQFSKDVNYIQMDRIKQNLFWKTNTDYGDLEITINLSKPEKDPKEIERAKFLPQNNYPKCLLCKENVGYSGNLNHPPRQNLRVIDLKLNNKTWFFQYSPYIYYNEHCIILDSDHIPMKITKNTFKNFLDFLDFLPHYFIGSNTDIPIVGGSILTHEHYQGGRHVFPMEIAKPYAHYKINNKNTTVSLLKWPMSVIRISDNNKDDLIDVASFILEKWKAHENKNAEIIPFTNDIRHNAITPIGRINKDGHYEFDLVLRNNRTNDKYPMGIFHPHEELHHIKKENIGLIEVMGLAILPGRLKKELDMIEDILSGEVFLSANEYENANHPLYKHSTWIETLTNKYGIENTRGTAKGILENEVGNIFLNVLEDAGVFKQTDYGREEFNNFMKSLGFLKM